MWKKNAGECQLLPVERGATAVLQSITLTRGIRDALKHVLSITVRKVELGSGCTAAYHQSKQIMLILTSASPRVLSLFLSSPSRPFRSTTHFGFLGLPAKNIQPFYTFSTPVFTIVLVIIDHATFQRPSQLTVVFPS